MNNLSTSRYEQCDPNDPDYGWTLYDDATVVEDVLKSATIKNAAGDDPIISGATPRSSNGEPEKENSYETKKQVSQQHRSMGCSLSKVRFLTQCIVIFVIHHRFPVWMRQILSSQMEVCVIPGAL